MRSLVLEVPSVGPLTGPSVPSSNDSSHGSAMGWTGLAVGGAGFVTLGVGGVIGRAAKSKANGASCDANNVCATPADVDQRHAAVQQAKVATIVVGVGAVPAVGGVVLWLAAPSRKPDGKAVGAGVTALGLGPTGFLLRGQF